MFNFKKSTIKILILTIVAAFNCCLPTTTAFHENEHNNHQAEQNESCPAQEKPDLDAVQVSTVKFQEETKFRSFTPKNKVLISFDPQLGLHQQNYRPIEDLNTKFYQIWGSQSEFSSGIYRL